MRNTFTAIHSVVLLLAAPFFMTFFAHATDICVGPSASGNGSGSDWNNMKAWSGTPARGDTWYLTDGSYTGKTFSVATSGITGIIIRKATPSSHGPNTGWVDTMGDGQARFSSAITFTTSNWEFNGVTGGGPGSWTAGFGFVVTETRGRPALSIGDTGSHNQSNIRISHVEVVGNDGSDQGGGAIGNDGLAVYTADSITLSYYYIHDMGRCIFFINASNFIAEYGYTGGYRSTSATHAAMASIWSFITGRIGDCTFRYNVFTHIEGTGGILWDNLSNSSAILRVYGNVWYKPASDTGWDLGGNGLIAGWGSGGAQFHNGLIYNNSFVNINAGSIFGIFSTIYSGNKAKNNLIYNSAARLDYSKFQEHDSNHYINSGGTHGEPNGTSAASGDPFVDFANLNFQLKANTAPGANLGSPYNVDPTGEQRITWTRGAYEYGTTGPSTNAVISVAPANLDFGSIQTNTTRDLDFTVENTGSGTLVGTASVNAPFSIVSSATYILGTGQSQSVTVRYSPVVTGSSSQTASFTGGGGATTTVSGVATSATASSPPMGLSFEAESGSVSAPFVITAGVLYQGSTTGLDDGGRAVYDFTVDTAGDYVIQALVNAPSLTANSVYLNIDAEPVDPQMAWDILPPTVGFENRLVSWRGNGTADSNEIVPKVFALTSGTHQLIIRGREAITQLDKFWIIKAPEPPQNLRAISTP